MDSAKMLRSLVVDISEGRQREGEIKSDCVEDDESETEREGAS